MYQTAAKNLVALLNEIEPIISCNRDEMESSEKVVEMTFAASSHVSANPTWYLLRNNLVRERVSLTLTLTNLLRR